MLYQFYAVVLNTFGTPTLLPNLHASKGRAIAYAQNKKRLFGAESYKLELLTLSDVENVPALDIMEKIIKSCSEGIHDEDVIDGEFTEESVDHSAEGEWR